MRLVQKSLPIVQLCEQSSLRSRRHIDDRIRSDRRIEERRRGNISVGKTDEIDNVRGLE
jgi:hypothetical protein